MKKIVSMIVTFAMVISSTLMSFASENIYTLPNPKTIEEVSALLDRLPNTQVIKSSEREMIANMLQNNVITRQELNEEMADLSHRSMNELKQDGYNEMQIAIIKDYVEGEDAYSHVFASDARTAKGSEDMEFRYGLAGTNTKKDIGIAYDITWNSCPFFTFTDSYGIGWIAADSNSREVITKINSVSGQIRLAKTDGTYTGSVRDVKMDKSSSNVFTGDPVIGSAQGEYGRRIGGYAQIGTQSDSYNMETIHVFIGYAHTTIKPTINATITIGWKKLDGSIAFSANKSQSLIEKHDHVFRYTDQGEIVA